MNNDLRISRRQFGGLAASAALAIGAGSLGFEGAASASLSAGSKKPRRGGVFTIGMITGGTSETLNPGLLVSYPDSVRAEQLYDNLFALNDKLEVVGRLIASAQATNKAQTWIFTIRDGVQWHDGKPFTVDDVVYNFQQWSQSTNYGNSAVSGVVDFKNVRASGSKTVEVPLLVPVADFPSLLASLSNFVVQAGSTPASFLTHPIGTGPFQFVSFTPGSNSVFDRNPNYWENGKPYVDRVVVDSSFTDDESRLNAMLSNQINVLPLMPFLSAKLQQSKGNMKILTGRSIQTYQICMDLNLAPFKDVRVRQAMKLLTNRQQMVDVALSGFGVVGSDLFGGNRSSALPYFDKSLQPTYDPDKAKSLLKSAGHAGLTFQMPTAEVVPGYTESIAVFAQNAKAAGVNVVQKRIPIADYYAEIPGGYLSRPIQASGSFPYGSLAAWYSQYFLSTGVFAETHWGSPAHDASILGAIGETNPQLAAEKWNAIQKQQFTQGGEIIWGCPDWVDGIANNVHGLKEAPNLFLNNARLLDGWIAD